MNQKDLKRKLLVYNQFGENQITNNLHTTPILCKCQTEDSHSRSLSKGESTWALSMSYSKVVILTTLTETLWEEDLSSTLHQWDPQDQDMTPLILSIAEDLIKTLMDLTSTDLTSSGNPSEAMASEETVSAVGSTLAVSCDWSLPLNSLLSISFSLFQLFLKTIMQQKLRSYKSVIIHISLLESYSNMYANIFIVFKIEINL